MSDIFHFYKSIISKEFASNFKLPEQAINESSFVVESPKNEDNGDLSTNICMVLSKELSEPPIKIAEILKTSLEKYSEFEQLKIAKPGFLNFRVNKSVWYKFLSEKLHASELYDKNIGNGQTINVEYVSANPTGPLHIGHCRGAVFGDVLSNLLTSTGYDVTKEYYVNDAGVQINYLADSVIIRIKEILNQRNENNYPDNFYPGEYLIDVAKKIIDKNGDTILEQDNSFELIKDESVALLLDLIKADLKLLSIEQDHFISEKKLIAEGKINEAITKLKDLDLIYEGILDKPKGKQIEDWEPREQMLFKSSNYGDETDRPLQKSNGEWTYFANDIAYHFDKYQRGSQKLIDIWGADHGGYIKRMNASIVALTNDKAEFSVKLCQMVKLISDGKQLKMSKRSGDFITIRELVDEVGSDSIRFMMLYRKNEAPLEFNFQKVTEQSKDNPVFYVQYAHARICSVIRNLEDYKFDLDLNDFDNCNYEQLKEDGELFLLKKIMNYSSIIETSATLEEPHRISYYLYDLASALHSLWNQGKIDKEKRFIDENNIERTYARIALLMLTKRTLKSGLDILGVSAPEEMQ
mgnify:FL=1